ncbi:MAG: hypothetical protein JRD47_09745 [Deltaproteobacteria bacterium]|nr:hypothetical protein [Deltaproteobacteria bacterium]
MQAVALTPIAQSVEKGLSLERRTNCRFEIQNGAMCSPQLTVVGQITDVSLGGLTFRYVASRDRSTETSVLSITLTNGTFQLDGIPFKVAWDVEMPQSFSCGPISLRRCGVEFGALMDSQKCDLEYFIRHCTATDMSAGCNNGKHKEPEVAYPEVFRHSRHSASVTLTRVPPALFPPSREQQAARRGACRVET